MSYSKVWISVDQNTYKGCSWSSYSRKENCNYVIDFVSSFKSLSFPVGVYTSKEEWKHIIGDEKACQDASTNVDLWYYNYDGIPTMNDYKEFGGWDNPEIKQYL